MGWAERGPSLRTRVINDGPEAPGWQTPDCIDAQTIAQRTSLTCPRSHSPFDDTLPGSYLFLRIYSSRKCSLVFTQNESKEATGFSVNQPWYGCRWKWGPSPGSQGKHFWVSTHGRVRCSGKAYWGRNKRLPPGSRCLISLPPVVEEV